MSPQIDYPEIAEGIMPRHRFMSAYEQRIEPPDRRWQYLLMAAEPYETIAFKVARWDPGGSYRVCSIQAAGSWPTPGAPSRPLPPEGLSEDDAEQGQGLGVHHESETGMAPAVRCPCYQAVQGL